MSFIGLLKVFCLVLFSLLWSELDEIVHVQESVEQGEFEVGAIRETLDSERGSYAEIWPDGSISIVLPEQGSVTIEASEAYSLLVALYDHRDLLRERANGTVPQEEPDPLVCQSCGKDVPWSEIGCYVEVCPALFECKECHAEVEQWLAEEPHLRLLTEQEMEELAQRMPDLPTWARGEEA